MQIAVLDPRDSVKYLGRKLCFQDLHEKEISHRIGAGWASFMKFKGELCGKQYSQAAKAMLFDAIVTPTVLYAAATWSTTADMERMLRTSRRRMIRLMFGGGRKPTTFDGERTEECWVDYIKRATHRAENIMIKYGSEDWVTLQRRRKWRFAGRVAQISDERWSRRLLAWRPDFGRGRSRGRPLTRWSDDIKNLAGEGWHDIEPDLWQLAEQAFVTRCAAG
jgi:hypothetical protein